jgi:hypothetical protein
LVPHTTGIYEQLPLLLIPQTKQRFAVLIGLSWLAAMLVYTVVSYGPEPDVVSRVERGLALQWPYFLFLVWLPSLYMVLRQPVVADSPLTDEQPFPPSVIR